MLTLPELIESLLKVKQLPTIPNVVVLLEKTLKEDHPRIGRICEIVSDDPAVTSMILKLANSAFYGARRTIGTVQEAVMRVGLQEIHKMVITFSLVKYMSSQRSDLLDPLGFWRHSIAVAIGNELICEMADVRENCAGCHVIGLLHDLGRWVSATYMPETHQSLPSEPEPGADRKDIVKLEKDKIGLDHAQIAAALLERWGLPWEIVQGVRYHHQPELSPKMLRKTAQVVRLADFLCNSHGIGDVGEGSGGPVPEQAWSCVGLESGCQEELVGAIKEKAAKSELLLSIGGLAEENRQ